MSDGQPRQVQCKEARSCMDWVERDFFNTGGVKGRTEFEYICSICGAPPEDSPLVADAVLGLRDGKKLLPCCEDCHAAKKKPLAYGKANQPVAQAAKRARKAEERTERAAKRPARGHGRGQLPDDSSDEDEEVGGARTPSPRAPALPCSGTSGSDEDSDEEDDESDSGSSPSDD